uniref:Cytochrome c oxidase subunit 3 n=1 Tax=Polyplax asiatica TaxID=1425297 RepID=V9PXI9_9NEOP|nr:cytochrome c oxidase subunit 3 [Polyplax asiatica]
MPWLSKFHPFHIVSVSPWPLLSSASGFTLAVGLVEAFSGMGWFLVGWGSLSSGALAGLWWRDAIRESFLLGEHTMEVTRGLRVGVILFILSEVMFFFSIFFAFFFLSLNPDVSLGGQWPPEGLSPVPYMGVPLMNTVLLLSSGISLTWSHHALIGGMAFRSAFPLLISVLLGGGFLLLQAEEYSECSFSISDSSFGSLFFVSTGFHGVHVMIGTVFLSVNLVRVISAHFSPHHHLGFEAGAWYWHFVDVVWLFLFITIYWWGS